MPEIGDLLTLRAGFGDLVAFSIAAGLVIAYYLCLRFRSRADAGFTVHAVNGLARARWVDAAMAGSGHEIMAIQTLRNSVMSASFMASTAILLIVATLTFTGSQDHETGIWHALNIAGATDDRAVAVKLVVLLADFFVAFFCFSMAIRYFNHVGYMITVPAQSGAGIMSPACVALYLNRAGRLYAFGTRAFFFCVPLVFWMFGPVFLVAATVALLIALYPFDRAPRQAQDGGNKPPG